MRKKRNLLSVKIAKDIIAAYKLESVSEMQDALWEKQKFQYREIAPPNLSQC